MNDPSRKLSTHQNATRSPRRDPSAEALGLLRRVLESFDRLPVDARSGAEHWEVVSENGRESLRYLKPLVANSMCLTCHGDPAIIPPDVARAIAEHYPDDRGTGFDVGDVRGAITIQIPLLAER
jgi:hypothetical protein